jgi:fumarylacetoacetate (FAA) hydrolase family protein
VVIDALINVGVVSQYLELEGDPEAEVKVRSTVEACLSAEKNSRKTK